MHSTYGSLFIIFLLFFLFIKFSLIFNQADGYNIGINCGESAGQAIPHAHIHVIPRYKGDMENPQGGVRGVIPDKQSY